MNSLLIDHLIGDWVGQGEIRPNPFGGAGATRSAWQFRRAVEGQVLIGDYLERRADGSKFAGHATLMRAAGAKTLFWYFFDSLVEPPIVPSEGVIDGVTIVLTRKTERGVGRTCFALTESGFRHTISFCPIGSTEFLEISSGDFKPALGAAGK